MKDEDRCPECGGSGSAIEHYPVGNLTQKPVGVRSQRVAVMMVAERLIEALMAFPENARIIEIRPSRIWRAGTMDAEFLVECEDFPAIAEGGVIPLITPSLTKKLNGTQGYTLFLDWNHTGMRQSGR